MTSKHTPGPWFWQDGIGGESLLSPGILVAKGRICEEDEANARLIAAAPDMLEALEGLLAHEPDYSDTLWENAHAAIAKARGQA